MNNSRIKNREDLLKNDKNVLFLDKWEKQSKRFGKKRLFDLFTEAYIYIDWDLSKEKFQFSFGSKVINNLKADKNSLYVKLHTYKDLASLFGKFKYSTEKYWDELYDVLSSSWTITTDKKSWEHTHWAIITQQSISDWVWEELGDNKNILDKIDLEKLYAYDPNENWWNR